jgi:hypothetical protein
MAPGEADEHDVGVYDVNYDIALTADGSRLLLYSATEPNVGWAFLRPTRGGPAIRLAEGRTLGLSPDGKWVLVRRDEKDEGKIVLVPTGPGEQRVIPTEGLRKVGSAWFLDTTHVLLNAAGEGKLWRTFLLDLAGGKPVPVTPEKTFAVPGSAADGFVIGIGPEGALARYPLGGGEPRPLAVRFPSETFAICADADARFLFLGERGVPGRIDRFDLATGRRIPWKTLQPDDPAGFAGVIGFGVTPNGAAYAYRYLRFLQNLYVVEGLR